MELVTGRLDGHAAEWARITDEQWSDLQIEGKPALIYGPDVECFALWNENTLYYRVPEGRLLIRDIPFANLYKLDFSTNALRCPPITE